MLFFRKSVFSKIFLSYLVLIALFVGIILFFSFKLIRQHYLRSFTESLKNISCVLRPQVVSYIESGKFRELDSFINDLSKRVNVRITIFSMDGKVIAASKRDFAGINSYFAEYKTYIPSLLKKKTKNGFEYTITVKEKMLCVATVLLDSNKKPVGVLITSLLVEEIDKLLDSLIRAFFEILICVVLVSALIAYVFSRNFSKPIKILAVASRQLAHGEFISVDLSERGDELGDLAKSFNEMSRKLERLFEDLKSKQSELEQIISSLPDGLAVLDRKGKILMCNNSFNRLTGTKNCKFRFYWEILREPNILELIDKAIKEGKDILNEVKLGSRYFILNIVNIKNEKEVILLLHDVTDFKKLQKIKRDFVANASHELRTPLTAIKGYLETLEDELESEEAKLYIRIMKRNTERIIRIVEDMLTLAELEDKDLTESFAEVNLETIVLNVVRMFKPKAKEKGLILDFKKEGEFGFTIRGDEFKLEQVFINLVDNAIKYTEKGKVLVSIKSFKDKVVVIVEDTGIGIPSKHLDRIFERFYVVDKSRSKNLGGTGLGLSIVKHIVQLHGGDIKVESVLGEGTRFIITFPR